MPAIRPRRSATLATLSVLAVLLVTFLTLARTAQAEVSTSTLEGEYAAALAYWGVPAPPQCEEVRLAILPTDPGSTAGDGSAAAATEPPPGALYQWCELNVFADEFPAGACLQQVAVDHEVGHLLGYGHSEDLTSIMYPTLQPQVWCPAEIQSPLSGPTTECRRTKRHPSARCRPAGSFPREKHHKKRSRARS